MLCVLLESIIVVRAVTRSYYRGAAGALLVYDISSRDSYNAISSWLSDARTLASPNIIVILVGNKKDLDAEREVTFMEATQDLHKKMVSNKLILEDLFFILFQK